MSTVEKPVAPTPLELALNIRKGWAAFVERDRRASAKRPYVYASSYRECVRQMTLEMVEGDKLPPWRADTLANFRRGEDRERDLLADLKRIGRNCDIPFEVIGEQERFELRDHKGRVIIVGKVDARLKFANGVSAPLECKAWNPQLVSKMKRFEDLLESRWTRSGAHQILCYLYGSTEPVGFMMLDRNGIPDLLPVELYPNLQRLEDFLAKAEVAMDHKEAGTLPDFIDDPGECKHCAFYGGVCNPPLVYPGAKILTDPAFIQDLEQWYELKPAATEFDRLDKDIKERLRGVESAIAGSFVVAGKWQKQTTYAFPDEGTKKKFQVSDPKGKFVLSITKPETFGSSHE